MPSKPIMRMAILVALMLGLTSCATVPVRQSALPLTSSPWGGGMTAAQQAASAERRPAYAEANWNHEVCVIAYAFEGVAQEIARRRAAMQRSHKEDSAEAEERRRIAELERLAGEHLPNIPKCTGQFYRPAVKHLCDQLASDNRFCAQLSGEALPGVELVEDEGGFVRGLAWNKVGDLFSKGIGFAPAPWAASDNRGIDLAQPELSGVRYIAATNKAVNTANGVPVGSSVGQWAFSIEMLRVPMAEEGDLLAEWSEELTSETGLTPRIGRYGQFPQVHFQAYMFDILVAGERAAIAVEMRDGTRHILDEAVPFAELPERSPAFYTSFPSYRIHAVAFPSADEMRLILRPDAAFLTASFPMTLEDGRVDTVSLRSPLVGIADAWKAMNAANLKAHRRIRRAEKR